MEHIKLKRHLIAISCMLLFSAVSHAQNVKIGSGVRVGEANGSTTVNGTTCTLGSSCTVQPQSAVVTVSTQEPTLTISSCGAMLTNFTYTSGPVTVTLPEANGSFAACKMQLLNSTGDGILVTPTTSTFNGVAYLYILPGTTATLWSDGTNWFGKYAHSYTQAIRANTSGDIISSPASANTAFSHTLTFPANLPVGSTFSAEAVGSWNTTAADGNAISMQMWFGSAGGRLLCFGDDEIALFNNENSGTGDWLLDCKGEIPVSGASGEFTSFSNERFWIGDCYSGSTCSGLSNNGSGATNNYPGSFWPGRDSNNLQNSAGGTTNGYEAEDLSASHQIYVGVNLPGADSLLTFWLYQCKMTVTIP